MKHLLLQRLLLVAMLFTSLNAFAFASYNFIVNKIYYEILSETDKTVQVTYKDFVWATGTYTSDYSGDIVIPSTVTYNDINYTVTNIDDHAFDKCTELTSVSIPNTVTNIDECAFYYCTKLKSITIPNSVTKIGDSAFANCIELATISVPESVIDINNNSFSNTAWYKNQLDGVIYINNLLYDYKGTMPKNTDFTVKEGTTVICHNALSCNEGLESVTIPKSVKHIGMGAFNGCSNLETVKIEDGCTAFINDMAFQGCPKLATITIPNSIIEISYYAFSETAWYNAQPDGPVYIGKVLYAYKGTMPENTNFIVNDGTVCITNQTFNWSEGLVSISIPNTVKSIICGAIGFCSGLTSIAIPNSVEHIGDYVLNGCSNLKTIYIGNSVKKIDEYAFNDLGDNLTEIISASIVPPTAHESVFEYSNLDNVTLYVPVGTKTAYANAVAWNRFKNIVEDDKKTAISETLIDQSVYPVEYYNLQGVKMTNPSNGIFIKKQGNKTQKVIMK